LHDTGTSHKPCLLVAAASLAAAGPGSADAEATLVASHYGLGLEAAAARVGRQFIGIGRRTVSEMLARAAAVAAAVR